MAEVVDVVPADLLVRRREYRITDPITTPEHAAWAFRRLPPRRRQADAIGDSIKAMVPPEGLTPRTGSVLRETKATITASDKRKALAFCKQRPARRRSRSLRSTTRREEQTGCAFGGRRSRERSGTRASCAFEVRHVITIADGERFGVVVGETTIGPRSATPEEADNVLHPARDGVPRHAADHRLRAGRA